MYEFLTEVMLRVVYKIPNTFSKGFLSHPELGSNFNCMDHNITIKPDGTCHETWWAFDGYDSYYIAKRTWPE